MLGLRRCILLIPLLALVCGVAQRTHAATVSQQPALEYTVYLPSLEWTIPEIQLYGYVTENGAPAAGVPVSIVQYVMGSNGYISYYDPLKTVSTDRNGRYNFTDVPPVRCDACSTGYVVVYNNTTADPQRLASWRTRAFSPARGETFHVGDFDIADVSRSNPQQVDVPPGVSKDKAVNLQFDWKPRGTNQYEVSELHIYHSPTDNDETGSPAGIFTYQKTFVYCSKDCYLSMGAIMKNHTYLWNILVTVNNPDDRTMNGSGATLPRTLSVPLKR